MPEMDGLETILALRKDARNVKIVALSGGGRIHGDNYLRLARKMGADRTIAKPFRRMDVIETLRDLIQAG